jgi:hypothetical protein
MALVKVEDFTLDTSLDNLGWGNSGIFSIQSSAGRFGAPAMRCSGDQHRWIPLQGNFTELYLNFAVNMSSLVNSNPFCIELYDIGNNYPQAGFALSFGGVVDARKGSRNGTGAGTLLGTSGITLTVGVQYHFEVYVKLHSSSGIVTIKKDGVQILNLTGINTIYGGSDCNGILVYGGSGQVDLSHFIVMDTTGSYMNGFIGDARCVTDMPTGNGGSTGMTPSAGSNYQCVDETPANNDTDYVQGAAGTKDRYTFPSVGVTASVVHVVVGRYKAEKTAAGALTIEPVLKSGGTENVATGQSLATGYEYFEQAWYVDPNTSAAWPSDLTAVNAAEIGQQAT